jgi:hypothetical protein
MRWSQSPLASSSIVSTVEVAGNRAAGKTSPYQITCCSTRERIAFIGWKAVAGRDFLLRPLDYGATGYRDCALEFLFAD